MTKCSHPDCARDGIRMYHGRKGIRGRPPFGTEGVPVCGGHYEQLRRGEPMHTLRKRGESPRAAAVRDCAAICDFHGHPEMANLLRKLGK